MADDEEIVSEEGEEEEAVAEEAEDEQQEEEVEMEAEPEPAPKPTKPEEPTPAEVIEEPKQLKRAPKTQKDAAPKEMTEAEIAMQEAVKRHEEEVEAKMREYEENRKVEKEEIEKELNLLKEKRELRQREMEEMEEQMAEKARIAEEHRRKDEAERLAQKDSKKINALEERKKQQAKMGGWFAGAHVDKTAPPNFVIVKRDKAAPFGGSSQAQETPDNQKEDVKKTFVAALMRRKMDPEALLENDLKKQILLLHKQICRLEAEKYDLEKRQSNQEYDLKELHEREKQAARNKAIKKGLDPNEAMESPHPPKIYVASKHDRQVDSRSYGDRRVLYEHPKLEKPPKLARGTPRPPSDWGARPTNEELELLKKNLGPRKYTEETVVEGAKPPIDYIPLKLPTEDEEEKKTEDEESLAPREKKKRAKDKENAAPVEVDALLEGEEITEGRDENAAFTLKLS